MVSFPDQDWLAHHGIEGKVAEAVNSLELP